MNMRSPGLFRIGGKYSDNLFSIFADKSAHAAGSNSMQNEKWQMQSNENKKMIFLIFHLLLLY